MTWFLAKLGIRFVVFGAVFGVVAHRRKDVIIEPKWALPLCGLVFAVLNTGLYWLLKPLLNLATLWTVWFLVPLLVNGFLLYLTDRLLKPLKIDGLVPLAHLAGWLTLAHGVLWVVLDKLV
jgi:hypothetical protein